MSVGLRRVPSSASAWIVDIVIDVVEQLAREERKSQIKAAIKRYALDIVTNDEVCAVIAKVKDAVDNGEGVTLTPWEVVSLHAYQLHNELMHQGERYR